jgi:hypothetical protein
MPCGNNRILTAFFGDLADRATAFGVADEIGVHPDHRNAGIAAVLEESCPVLDAL